MYILFRQIVGVIFSLNIHYTVISPTIFNTVMDIFLRLELFQGSAPDLVAKRASVVLGVLCSRHMNLYSFVLVLSNPEIAK